MKASTSSSTTQMKSIIMVPDQHDVPRLVFNIEETHHVKDEHEEQIEEVDLDPKAEFEENKPNLDELMINV